MSYTDRKKQILSLLEPKSSIEVSALPKLLYASEATVRRDLAKLEEEGLIIRSHGKALSVNFYADKCIPFDERESVGFAAKLRHALFAHIEKLSFEHAFNFIN